MNKNLKNLFTLVVLVVGLFMIVYIFSLQNAVAKNISESNNAEVAGISVNKSKNDPQEYNLEITTFFDKFLNIQGDGEDLCQNYSNYSLEDMYNQLETIQTSFGKTENLFDKYKEKFVTINQECLNGNGTLTLEAIQKINSINTQL